MKKQKPIIKSLLCEENPINSVNYENFAMQLMSKHSDKTNIIALTCDTDSINSVSVVALNVAYNLTMHDRKVLIINCDTFGLAFNDLFGAQNDNDNIINYGKVDIILPKNTDFVGNMTAEEMTDKYSDYDYVLLVVPSPIRSVNYLAVQKNTNYYLLITQVFSSFYKANKCIEMITAAESKVMGSVYIKIT